MSLTEIRRWIDQNRDVAFDLMRVYIGVGLFVKGLQFIQDKEFLLQIMRRGDVPEFKFGFVETFLPHYVAMAHLAGGLLLAAGLMTRISTLFQLPILFGAAFLIYGREGVFAHDQEFQFTALVLFLLLLILFHGAGRLSVDHYLRSR